MRLLEKSGFQLLRAIAGNPHGDGDAEDCFLYVLLNPYQNTASPLTPRSSGATTAGRQPAQQ